MSREEIQEIVVEIFGSLFENTPESALTSLQKQSTEGWDSMTQVNLVAALEGEFDVVIELTDATELSNVEDCVNLIESLV